MRVPVQTTMRHGWDLWRNQTKQITVDHGPVSVLRTIAQDQRVFLTEAHSPVQYLQRPLPQEAQRRGPLLPQGLVPTHGLLRRPVRQLAEARLFPATILQLELMP